MGGAKVVNNSTFLHVAGRVFLIVLVATIPAFTFGQEAVERAGPCSSPEHRQFNFWVGKWDVYPAGKDNIVAHSLIESVYGSCGVRENWMPLSGAGGGSLNIYVPKENVWRQTWIDSKGARVDFKGGWNGSAMVLEGLWSDVLGPGRDALVRMTYSKAGDGSVRQLGEASQDGGKTWTPSFDLTYRQAKR
jgi:hypothetical protein